MPAALPTELWRRIFTCATRIRDFLDTSPRSRFERPYRLGYPFINGHDFLDGAFEAAANTSMQTKLSIIKVSKSWYIVAMEYLFELAIIRDRFQLESFVNAIQTSYGLRTLGWFVRQVIIVLPHYGTLSPDLKEAYLIDVFKHCPRLVMFTDSTIPGLSLPSIAAGTSNFSSIRLLEWAARTGPTFDVLSMYSDLLTGLEILSLMNISDQEMIMTLPPLSFPRLHTLVIDISTRWEHVLPTMGEWSLPALRNVICESATGGIDCHCEAFFKTHGPKIKGLDIPFPRYDICDILSMCAPSLEELVIMPFTLISFLPRMENLKHLGVTETDFVCRGSDEIDIQVLFSLFRKFTSNQSLPSFKLLRLFGFVGIFDLSGWFYQDVKEWRDFGNKWRAAGVRVEDDGGNVVEMPEQAERYCIRYSDDEYEGSIDESSGGEGNEGVE